FSHYIDLSHLHPLPTRRPSDLIHFTSRSHIKSLQLYRISTKERQRQLLQASLKNLEAAVLTARSGTSEEARLRTDEAALLLEWVDRKSTRLNSSHVKSSYAVLC